MPIEKFKLKNVKMYRINLEEADRINFISEIYAELPFAQSMIFVDKIADGEIINTRLQSEGIPAKVFTRVGQRD